MNKLHRLFALFITAALTVSIIAPCASAAYYEAFDHPDVAYADMAYTGVDVGAVDAFCARFAEDPAALYPALLELYDEIYTQDQLAYIRMCRNAGDAGLSAECEQAEADYAYAAEALYVALSKALNGEHADALRAVMPEDEADGFAAYEPLSESAMDASSEETALIRQYYLLPDDADFADAAAAFRPS